VSGKALKFKGCPYMFIVVVMVIVVILVIVAIMAIVMIKMVFRNLC
jgi:hypothetical protein